MPFISITVFSIATLWACVGEGVPLADKAFENPLPQPPAGGTTGEPAPPPPPTVTPRWSTSVFAGNPGNFADGIGTAARFSEPAAITSDHQGHVYIADSGNHVIRKINVATNSVTTLAGDPGKFGFVDGPGVAARFNSPQGISYDGSAHLYVADTGNSAVRKIVIATGAVSTIVGLPRVIGDDTYGTGGHADGPVALARFWKPTAAVYVATSTIYVLDRETAAVRKIDLSSNVVSTEAGGSRAIPEDGIGTAARFLDPACAVYDGQNALFIADFTAIRKFDLSTKAVTTLAGGNSGFGSGFNDGVGMAAGFNGPSGITYDGVEYLYVADTGGDTIRRVSISTAVVTTLAGSALQIGPDDGIGSAAAFYWPKGITYDGAGFLFVADTQNNAIRKIDVASRSVTTIAGALTAVDGIGLAARLYQPVSMTADGNGNLYVLDAGANNIRKIEISSTNVSTIAGNAMRGGDFLDGVGTNARFQFPHGIASDNDDALYIADTDNHSIRKVIVSSQLVTTIAGGSHGSADGIGAGARFSSPWGIAYDATGSLYVADTWNNTIRKINLASRAVSTIAGTATSSCGHADGVGASARFCRPAGLAYDGAGVLYIADRDSGFIRKMDLVSGLVTTIAGNNGYGPESDGIGSAAKFSGPTSLYLDSHESLFVTDWIGKTVRKVSISTGKVETIGGADPACYYPNICPQTSSRFGQPMGISGDAAGRIYIGDAMSFVVYKMTLD